MKILTSICFFILFTGCKTKQENLTTKKTALKTVTNCPKDGVCTVEIIPNSLLNIKSDEFRHIYTTIEKGAKIIFKFIYTRTTDEAVADGHYIEEIYAEFDTNLSDLTLEDKSLHKVKLLFNRMCYCKGSAGFYPISKGNLSLKKMAKNTYNIQLSFTIDEVPQVITSINENFTID